MQNTKAFEKFHKMHHYDLKYGDYTSQYGETLHAKVVQIRFAFVFALVFGTKTRMI